MGNGRIEIDEEKCVGCGLCAATCHQSVIALVDGKARIVNETRCDSLGRCLPVCPVGAITIGAESPPPPLACGCSGMHVKSIEPQDTAPEALSAASLEVPSRLRQWPVQMRLVPADAPYFDGAHLLVAADCAAYAYGNFHADFMCGRIAVIGCPKLDSVDYAEKLTAILQQNDIASVTVVRMEVPCCCGIENAAEKALAACGKQVPLRTVVLSTDGRVCEK